MKVFSRLVIPVRFMLNTETGSESELLTSPFHFGQLKTYTLKSIFVIVIPIHAILDSKIVFYTKTYRG